MKIIKPTFTELLFVDFAKIILQEWASDFFQDIADHGYDIETYIGIENEEVLVGCFLTDRAIINAEIQKEENKAKIEKLRIEGYYNFSYFITKEKYRGQGKGAIFFQTLEKQFKIGKYWLCCEEERISFYKRLGFTVLSPEPDHDNIYLMSYGI